MECLGNCNACENARCALEYEDEKQKEEQPGKESVKEQNNEIIQ